MASVRSSSVIVVCAVAALVGLLFLLVAPVDARQAPARYRVRFTTSRGDFEVAVVRANAPHGADRFYDLVRSGYFDGARFFRVVPGFVVQWGLAAEPAATKKWASTIPDDPVKLSNKRGTLTFAASGEPNSRNEQVFINYGDNARLDGMGFAPIGTVTRGMNVVDHVFAGYGEQPDQGQLTTLGNRYLQAQFRQLDYIKSARIERPAGHAAPA